MTFQLSPSQTRIYALSEVLLSELHESAAGPLQDRLADALNEVINDLDGATLSVTLASATA
jgi:hypothetical protein